MKHMARMTFTVTPVAAAPAPMAGRPGPGDPKDHKAWLAHWASQLGPAIAEACAYRPSAGELDHRLLYAMQCARSAHARAMKAHPRLKSER